MILSILGLSMITISVTSFKTYTAERDDHSAFYIAEAGLNYKENKLKNQIITIYGLDEVVTEGNFSEKLPYELQVTDERYEEFERVNGQNPYANISVTQLEDDPYKYLITSTGVIGDEKRTVSRTLSIEWQDKYEFIEEDPSGVLPPFAVFTSGKFKMNNGSITGDIGTTSTEEGSISFPGGGPSHNGIIYVPDKNKSIVDNKAQGNISSDIKMLDEKWEIPDLPSFPDVPTDFKVLPDELIYSDNGENSILVIENGNLLVDNWIAKNYELKVKENLYFKSIRLNEDNKLYLNVGNSDKKIVVDHLNVTNGHIELLGKGRLTIYVTDQITMGSASTINKTENVERLNIYFKGSEKITLTGGQKIYGSLYAKQADISLTGGGGFVGNIFTKGDNIEVSGGSDNRAQLFFAPNAEFKVSEGGTIRGKVISDSFDMTGGGTIKHEDLYFTDGPISPDALEMGNGDSNDEGSPGNGNMVETGSSPNISTGPLQEVDE